MIRDGFVLALKMLTFFGQRTMILLMVTMQNLPNAIENAIFVFSLGF